MFHKISSLVPRALRLAATGLAVAVCAFTLSGCTLLDKNTKAGLQIITGDVASTVFLNGQYLEKTPLIEKELKPGDYTVRIQPDDPGFVAHETQVTLRKGLLTVITWKPGIRPETSGGVIYEMEPLKNKQSAEVSFVTIPDGAIITLEGKEKEFSPVIIPSVSPGKSEFEVTLPSYETQRHTINVVQGFRMLVSVKLAKLESSVEPSPAPTSNASDSANLAPSATSSATTAPSASSSAQQAGPSVQIMPTGYFKDGKEALRVRETPSVAGTEIGFVYVDQTYPYLGTTTNNWLQISVNDKQGWVSADYAKLVQ